MTVNLIVLSMASSERSGLTGEIEFEHVRVDAELRSPVEVLPAAIIPIDRKRALDPATGFKLAVNADRAANIARSALARSEIVGIAGQSVKQEQTMGDLDGARKADIVNRWREITVQPAGEVAFLVDSSDEAIGRANRRSQEVGLT